MKRLSVGVIFAFVCISISPAPGASTKERNWQEGKLIDIASQPYT